MVFGFSLFGQGMEVLVDGMVAFDNSNFNIREAGADFPQSIESESSLFVSITSKNHWDKHDNPNKKWRIEIHKSDHVWNDDFVIEVKRNGNGRKSTKKKGKKSKINGGENYQPIGAMPNYFFDGTDQISEIPLKVKLSGFSIIYGARDYETSLILTVYDD